ncbi:UNVERIFIED_CONTAM: hypothetical protein FKN15_071737 [Acipenser sinensis]
MEGWRDGCWNLEDLLGGLEDQGWCLACGVYGHTVKICPFQEEEEEEPAQVGRRTQEGPEHPQPRREETEPFPSSEEMLDWVSDPEWNWEDLPKVVDLLWARDGEHWEHWEQHYYPVPFVNPAAVVINYLAADMGLPQQVDFQTQGDYTLLPPSSPGDYTLLPPSLAGAERPELPLPLPPSPAGAEQQELSLPPPMPGAEQQELPLPPPLPPAEGECLLGPLPPAEGQCLLSPLPPAEGKCLLVSLPRPPSSPLRGEEQELPLPPSPPGEELQELPLPSQEVVPRLDAGIPQQSLHSLLRGAQRKAARPRLRRGPAPPQPLPQWPTTAPRLVLTPAPPKDASLASPKDASLASPKDACLASPGAAWCFASPGAA